TTVAVPKHTTSASKRGTKGGYGVTPFPEFGHPTPEEAKEVFDILTVEHGVQKRPEKLVASLTFTGCGEVPTVLDAVLRTVVSANTSIKISCEIMARIVSNFGVKGSTVDWEAVYEAEDDDLSQTMAKGGLGKIKTKPLKGILQRAKEECLEL